MSKEGFEKAINVFFRRPGLDFTRQMRSALDQDPDYLKSHREQVTRSVKEVLTKGGIFWDEEILNEDAAKLVWEAVIRLRGVEKARSPGM